MENEEDFTELEQLALDIIGEVDYDIYKECQMTMIDEGSDCIVDGIVTELERYRSKLFKEFNKESEGT